MGEQKEKEERNIPINIYAVQPADGRPNDANVRALDDTWDTWYGQENWTVINDVYQLRNHIKARCGDKCYVRYLRIGGHGSLQSFRLGKVVVNSSNIKDFKPVLQEIIPYLILGKSIVCLDHCEVGNDELLLKSVSDAFGGIPVIAGLGDQVNNEGAPVLEGAARVCGPNTCFTVENPGLAFLI